MKLENWASLAEIVGAMAVVISLVYVGIQVHDSAGAARSAAANDVNVAMQEWYMQAGSDRQTSTLLYRGLVSGQALPDEEEFQFLMMTHAFFMGVQNSYLLAQEGTIDEELRNSLKNAIHGIQNLPGMNRYWRQRRSYLHSGFVEWVEQITAGNPEVTMDLYNLDDSSRSATDTE
jgi:hypothetical protein